MTAAAHPLPRTFTATARVVRYDADPTAPAEPGDGPLLLTLIDESAPGTRTGQRWRITVTHRASGLSFRGTYPATSAGLRAAQAVRDGLLVALTPAELADPAAAVEVPAVKARIWDAIAPHCAEVRRVGRPAVPAPEPEALPPSPADLAAAILDAARDPADPHLRGTAIAAWLEADDLEKLPLEEIQEIARIIRETPHPLRLRARLVAFWHRGDVGALLQHTLERDLLADHGPYALASGIDLRDPPHHSADGTRAIFRLAPTAGARYLPDAPPRDELRRP